jgi:hypothetical protein
VIDEAAILKQGRDHVAFFLSFAGEVPRTCFRESAPIKGLFASKRDPRCKEGLPIVKRLYKTARRTKKTQDAMA